MRWIALLCKACAGVPRPLPLHLTSLARQDLCSIQQERAKQFTAEILRFLTSCVHAYVPGKLYHEAGGAEDVHGLRHLDRPTVADCLQATARSTRHRITSTSRAPSVNIRIAGGVLCSGKQHVALPNVPLSAASPYLRSSASSSSSNSNSNSNRRGQCAVSLCAVGSTDRRGMLKSILACAQPQVASVTPLVARLPLISTPLADVASVPYTSPPPPSSLTSPLWWVWIWV